MAGFLIVHPKGSGKITLAGERDMFGTNRQYAQALVEHPDDCTVWSPVGEERVLW